MAIRSIRPIVPVAWHRFVMGDTPPHLLAKSPLFHAAIVFSLLAQNPRWYMGIHVLRTQGPPRPQNRQAPSAAVLPQVMGNAVMFLGMTLH
jgi:hypothetical protein